MIIIYKIKYDGTALLYVTYFGGASQDAVYGLSLSPDKSVIYACGYTNSSGLPMAGTPFDNAISTTMTMVESMGIEMYLRVISHNLQYKIPSE